MPRTVLFSFAHPDDESFLGVGLSRWCREHGARVVLLCATRGERGKAGDEGISGGPRDLGEVRERELRDAARIAGIEEVHLLGYRDRELAGADPAAMRRLLVGHLRRLRPDVVVTFDPNGFNVHPDHVAISRFTSDAIAAAADPRWLRDAGPPHAVARLLWTPPLEPRDAARAAQLAAEPGVDFLIDISPWRSVKAEALRAHRTQHRSVEEHFFSHPDIDRILSFEVYRHAWGPSPGARPSTDIFAGIP